MLDDAEVFDPVTGIWTTLPTMVERRCSPDVVALGGKLYVVGGFIPYAELSWGVSMGDPLPGVEVFDPATEAWTMLPRMANIASSHRASALGGKLYVIGGRVKSKPRWSTLFLTADAQVFDPDTQTWTALQPMASPPCHGPGGTRSRPGFGLVAGW